MTIPVNTAKPDAGDQVNLGVVRIEEQAFTAVVLPAPESSWIMLGYFSFEPLRTAGEAGGEGGEAAADRRERLKALGYMQ